MYFSESLTCNSERQVRRVSPIYSRLNQVYHSKYSPTVPIKIKYLIYELIGNYPYFFWSMTMKRKFTMEFMRLTIKINLNI